MVSSLLNLSLSPSSKPIHLNYRNSIYETWRIHLNIATYNPRMIQVLPRTIPLKQIPPPLPLRAPRR